MYTQSKFILCVDESILRVSILNLSTLHIYKYYICTNSQTDKMNQKLKEKNRLKPTAKNRMNHLTHKQYRLQNRNSIKLLIWGCNNQSPK